MKKIWPWIGLLLLLMIICVWTKLDTIRITKQSIQHTPLKSTGTSRHEPVDFDIVQSSGSYHLSGHFADTEQPHALTRYFAEQHRTLSVGNTQTDRTLVSHDVIPLLKVITPHFIRHYKNGHIGFHHNILTIEGTADSYDAKRMMQSLLNRSTLHTRDETEVMQPAKPISFVIKKVDNILLLEGEFGEPKQYDSLLHSDLYSMVAGQITPQASSVDRHHVIKFVQDMLPLFADRYTKGYIAYHNEILTVEGLAKDQAALDKLSKQLQLMNIKVVNHTKIDPKILEEQREKQEAAERERERNRAAQEAALKAKKARQEALKAAKEAERIALLKEEAEAAKENIVKLLKIENIEFEVAKGRLTAKGNQTVNKLASILKQYPDISIEIAGYTDSDGDAEFNRKLSQARVESVKDALIEQGISPDRMQAKGYGEENPLLPNTTASNKQANRRVEIHILGE